MSQPQAGPAGQPAAQPGTGYPAQPSAGPSGAASSISIKGILIAAAAIVAIVIAALAAFFVLRPNPPQQTAAQQSPTTADNPPPGDTPAATAPTGPLLRGTYNEHNEIDYPSGHGSNNHVMKFSSDCPGCDATGVNELGDTGTLQWNGTGWTSTTPGSCGAVANLTPTSVVNGIVQEASGSLTGCNFTLTTTWTRTGD
jgi:hypothetical protein